jgi:methylenetetrahydrofolate--tRNA-(uracil-5-)-methyltransferase
MGANFGILPELENRPRDKKQRGQAYADRALNDLKQFLESVII